MIGMIVTIIPLLTGSTKNVFKYETLKIRYKFYGS